MLEKKRKLLIVLAILALAAQIASSFFSQKADADIVTIRASVNKDCSGTPWFAGVEKGFFKNGGVNFEDVGQIAYPQRPAAFVSGQMDVFDEHPSTLINLIKSGAPIIGVAQSGDEPTNGDINKRAYALGVLEDSPLKTPADILTQEEKVKINVVSLGICADTQNKALLRKYNISADKIEYVVLPDTQAEQVLRQGLVDIAVLHPPFYFAAEKHGGVRILASSKEPLELQAAQRSSSSRGFRKEASRDGKEVHQSLQDTEKWANENREAAGKLTAEDIGLEEAAVHCHSGNGKINESQLLRFVVKDMNKNTADIFSKLQLGQYLPG